MGLEAAALKYRIRPIEEGEIPLLRDFLYEAVFQRDERNPIPRSIIEHPDVRVYIEDFGRPDDLCLVAADGDRVVGAVWTRILSGRGKGFGNVDAQTPVFAISLYKEYRGRGIGTELMRSMIDLLRAKGYKRASLSVQKDNYAVRMYERAGFSIVDENDEDFIMAREL